MKRSFFALVAFMSLLLLSCSEQQQDLDFYSSHKPYTRWWWFSSEIDDNDIREQLVWLRDHDFGGVEIAWIYPMGLDSTTAHPAFLSTQWANHVRYAKRVADSLGLGCDFTFGTLWPFSDVDLPDGDQARTFFDSVGPARRNNTWDYPREARILNHLDREAFFRYATKMNQGLAEAYKGSPSGVFVDSWEVETEYLWTKGFEKRFMQEHGYDIVPYMEDRTLLDEANAEVFYDYMSTLSNYVLREFYSPFAENARSVGAFSRAQCGGAPTDLLTAFSLVDVPETEALLYEPSFSKIAVSAASLAGKKVVTAETFTCAYGWTSLLYNNGRGHSPYQGREQVADLKLICDALFANGTNQIIWHGMPFNRVGDTSNFFYTTCQISTHPQHSLTGEPLKRFNQYMTQVSDYMSRGHNYSDLAVYIPLEDAWMGGAYPDSVRKVKAFFWGEYEMRFINTPKDFKGMQPLWVNKHFLSQASFSDGVLHCGACNFKALYIDVEYMDREALREVLRLAQQGLPICMVRDPKESGKVKHNDYAESLRLLHQCRNVGSSASIIQSAPLIEGESLPDFWCRQEADTYYIFFANPLSQTISYPLEYRYAYSDTGATRRIIVNHHGKSQPYTLRFEPQHSILLKVDKLGIQPIDMINIGSL